MSQVSHFYHHLDQKPYIFGPGDTRFRTPGPVRPPLGSGISSQCAGVARAASFASPALLRGLHPVRQALAADKMHPASGRRKPNSPSLGFASLFPRGAHFDTPLTAMSSSAQTIFAGCEARVHPFADIWRLNPIFYLC